MTRPPLANSIRQLNEIKRYRLISKGEPLASLRTQNRIAAKWSGSRKALHAFKRKSRAEIDAFKLGKIMELVDHAFLFHPFYRELYRSHGYELGAITSWKDFEALPVINKNTILDNFEAFEDVVRFAAAEVYFSRTSGSSGRIQTIIQDPAASDLGILGYLRFYEEMLGRERRPEECVYEVYLAPPRVDELLGDYPVVTTSQDCPANILHDHLKSVRPSILSGFPSYLHRMACSENDLHALGIRAICTNSESSTALERQKIADAFACPVFDEYSSEELYLIATQCTCGHYHVIEDNVHLEALTLGDAHFPTAVGTSLVNRVMPFIRYCQGDVLTLTSASSRCACGSNLQMIESFAGRADMHLIDTSGRVLPPEKVMAMYDSLLLSANQGLEEFRIHQSADHHIMVQAKPAKGKQEQAKAALMAFSQELRHVLSDPKINVAFKLTNHLPQLQSHKRRIIVSDVAHSREG